MNIECHTQLKTISDLYRKIYNSNGEHKEKCLELLSEDLNSIIKNLTQYEYVYIRKDYE